MPQAFGLSGSARYETLSRFGLRHTPNETLLSEWQAAIEAQLAALNLNMTGRIKTMNVLVREPRRLESYVYGRWVPGTKDGAELRDASTGAPVATIDSTGVDFASSVAYGRDKAGPALRAHVVP